MVVNIADHSPDFLGPLLTDIFQCPEQRKSNLALLEVQPCRLAGLLIVQIVENVILDLESLAQALRVSPDSVHLFFRSTHGHCPGSRSRDEQLRRLVVDYLVVILFQRVPGIGFLELKQLTLSEIGKRSGENAYHFR